MDIFTYSTAQVIAIFTALGVFFFIIFLSVLRDEYENKNSRRPRAPDEWLFTRWDEKLYDAFLKEKPEVILQKLGVKTEQYVKDCRVIKIFNPNLKRLAARKLIGIFVILIALLMLVFAGINGIFLTVVLSVVGYIVYEGGVSDVSKKAKERRVQLYNELPRFMDLLQTALYINIPVDDAITVTCRYLRGTLIAEEMKATMAETQIGAVSWQKALEDIARVYEVDAFSDFVLYLVTGYEKGLSIYDVVSRQTKELRDSSLVLAEENAAHINNAILIPIAVYKLVPLLLLAGLPIMIRLFTDGSIL